MESLIYLINSYLNSRSALLRSLEDHSLSTAMLTSSVLTSSVISNRRRNQTTWRPDELAKLVQLVSALGRWPGIHDQENSILLDTDSTLAITS